MALDEARRHDLHEAARRAFGPTAGDALMELLPPVGWADVATKRDLEVLSIEIRAAITDAVRGAEHRILMWMFTTVLAGIGISVAAAAAVVGSV